jgi:hypothetical protein
VLRRVVRTGPIHDGQIEIISGLKGGEEILLNPIKEQ